MRATVSLSPPLASGLCLVLWCMDAHQRMLTMQERLADLEGLTNTHVPRSHVSTGLAVL